MKFNIYCGSNSINEIFIILKNLIRLKKFNDKKIVNFYENKFKKKTNQKYSYAFASGRMSLYAGLKSLGIKKDDEVIIPAFTCVVVANAIKYLEAKPIYCDIKKKDFNIDLYKIKKLINNKTRVIYIQHTFGQYCNYDPIVKFCKKRNISIIEDCAHYFPNKKDLKFFGKKSDFIYFSTDHSKFINTHLGGMILTNKKNIANKISTIQENSIQMNSRENFFIIFSIIFENIFYHPKLYNFTKIFIRIFAKLKLFFYFKDELKITKPERYPVKLTSYQALIGINQLSLIERNIKHRINVTKKISSFVKVKNNVNRPLLRYSFLVKSRKKFINEFAKYFDFDIWYDSVLHGRKNKLSLLNYKSNSCKNAEFICKNIVNFPTHQRIDLKFLEKILKEKKLFLEKNLLLNNVK
jgi:perosamine synthetase